MCAIHQPNFFPRLSTLAKLFASDVWVVLDDVQFARRDYQHRCRLAALADVDHQQWLTLPVHLPYGRATTIRDVRVIDPGRNRRRVARLLQHYYGRSPHWPALQEPLRKVLEVLDSTDRLADISEVSTRALLDLLGWPGSLRRSSQFSVRHEKSERLADLTCAVGATTYLHGTGGAKYLNPWPFTAHGLRTELFTTPEGHPMWRAARRITAMRALTAMGPIAVADELQRHLSLNPPRR
ncbi:MAG: hypothetical protein GEV03_22135 [Streptosporangiales bacterium]|nr:hypothetical protein [Streptosporangiales bacterium]